MAVTISPESSRNVALSRPDTKLNALYDMNKNFYNAGGLLIKDKQLLVVKPIDRDAFLIPGGVIEQGEDPKEALVRGLQEELNLQLSQENLEEYGVHADSAIGFTDRTVHMHTYLIKNWEQQPLIYSDGEIESEFWLNSKNMDSVPIGNILKNSIIPKLIKDGLIE